ncbi:NAD(P)H-hydrate dehydratase [Microbacterium gallinarum]|uniref:ADP-dependent (S)-NAD(P)H-hydrate dehydratase n=1 Tax=Microbacterium gallinarum TaxID=2762209 RepID=A0ABR8X0M4_9MICO|nr:NAD(P)H-hydrate dehydratase [Microbacterium gallinarum]MBD8022876.1 NAD(P)H-hydrate dehydratase [Microbacterium gallinarum]
MSSRPERVGPELLRGWGLPDPGDSKKARGDVLVVGGSRSAPGAALLAGEAALRVGAGRIALAVPGSIDAQVGVALPEAGVLALPDHADDPFEGDLLDHVTRADVVLVGPGFDDPDETRATLLAVVAAGARRLVLDAFALGVLPSVERDALPPDVVLSPNKDELGILLDRDLRDETTDVADAARRFDAVVGCYGTVAHPDGRLWRVDEGGAGLGTSGSGDVLAGAIAGFVARGLPIERAAVWGAWIHARAGSRLEERVGLGFLARDLTVELTPTVRDTLAAD